MYDLTLEASWVPPQADDAVRETTVGDVLREQAAARPQAEALVEVDVHGRLARRWTFGELLADAERLARALASRFRPANASQSGRPTRLNG